MAKNPVVHFEMPFSDKGRMKKFYSQAFGWDMQEMGEEYGDYVMAMTTESDEHGPKEKGAINGGFYPKQDDSENCHLVISVDNLDDQIKIVKEAGGEIINEPMDIPKVGKFVMVKDTEGNKIGMLEPVEM